MKNDKLTKEDVKKLLGIQRENKFEWAKGDLKGKENERNST